MRLAVFVIVMLMSLFATAQNDTTTGSIRGVISEASSGESIPFCTVRILDSTHATQTDIDGLYVLRNIKPGQYDICAQMFGYVSDTIRNVAVNAGKFTQVNFHLKPLNNNDSIVIGPHPPIRPVPIIPVPIVDPVKFHKRRFAVVAGTEAILMAGSLIMLNELWYKQYPRSSFHTFNDNAEWMQMDKIGHVQTAYSTGLISSRLLYWTGMKYKRATWIGGLTGFAYLTAIEIMDGYSVGWGFSVGDMIANTSGSALFISQELIWNEQRIQPKFGFRRSGYAHYRPELLGAGYHEELLKDYNGQTYWLSVNVASFLNFDNRFPKWLNVAIGYGANGMTGGHENPVMYNSQGNEITLQRYRQYYISLDVDLRKLHVKSRFLQWVFTFVSFIKIPAPGIELSKYGVRPILFAF